MRLKPTGLKPAFLRECIDVLSVDPPAVRWRRRPLAHFPGKYGERDCETWNNLNAGRRITPTACGRLRITIGGRELALKSVIAEIGLTPLEEQFADLPGHALDGPATTGLLAAVIQEASEQEGLSLKELTVLGNSSDPYRADNPTKRRHAEWFVEQWRANDAVHIRGLHYKLIGRVTKPDGKRYTGSYIDFRWLGKASLAARWLGLISFEEFEDRRNGDPFTYRADRNTTPLTVGVGSNFDAEPPTVDIFDGEDGELRLFPTIEGMNAEQQFVLAIFGEKSSIRGETEPLAIELGADLYLETGEQSLTHVYHIAKRAYQDGRDLVVACVTDCDPAGYQMAVSIARKLQALIDLEFSSLNATVIHVGLTPAQVRQYRLPSSPLNPKELRRSRWRERMGVEQTEIDALLTLYPGALTQMLRKAFKPYYDPTLAARVNEAEREWRAQAEAEIERQIEIVPDLGAEMEATKEKASNISARIERLDTEVERMREAIDWINGEAEEIKNEIAGINTELEDIASQIDLEPPDFPAPDLPDQPDDGPNLVFSSAWDWVEATENMRARKAYEVGDGEEADD